MADQKGSLDSRELENMILLKGVDLESIQGVLDSCFVQSLKKGDILIRAGQRNHSLYYASFGSFTDSPRTFVESNCNTGTRRARGRTLSHRRPADLSLCCCRRGVSLASDRRQDNVVSGYFLSRRRAQSPICPRSAFTSWEFCHLDGPNTYSPSKITLFSMC